jgi:RNA polymerase sigma-70 factor (ECF subfamily)
MTAARAEDDRVLVARFLDGDRRAFDELMGAHEDRVFSICLRVMRNREAALDALQETFITVFRKAHMYNGESAFSTWLYRVAMNTCYDELRKRKRRAADSLPDFDDPSDPTSQDPFTSAELRPELHAALNQISPEFAAAVILSDIEGLSIAEAAEVLDVAQGTVKSRVFRGRRMLADILGNQTNFSERHKDDHA